MWRLGQNGDFTLTSPDGGPTTDSFPTSQYAATVTPTGTILCWDGNPSGHSRAVELAVDPRRGKASIVWQYQDPTPFFSPYGGNAALLANGDVLVNDGVQLSSAESDRPDQPEDRPPPRGHAHDARDDRRRVRHRPPARQ